MIVRCSSRRGELDEEGSSHVAERAVDDVCEEGRRSRRASWAWASPDVSAKWFFEVVLIRSRPGIGRIRQRIGGGQRPCRQGPPQRRRQGGATRPHPRDRPLPPGAPERLRLRDRGRVRGSAVEAEATKKAQALSARMTSFASNTSTLPITSLAQTSLSPRASSACTSSRLVVKCPSRNHHGRADRRSGACDRHGLCARDKKTPSWSTTAAASTSTAASSTTCRRPTSC